MFGHSVPEGKTSDGLILLIRTEQHHLPPAEVNLLYPLIVMDTILMPPPCLAELVCQLLCQCLILKCERKTLSSTVSRLKMAGLTLMSQHRRRERCFSVFLLNPSPLPERYPSCGSAVSTAQLREKGKCSLSAERLCCSHCCIKLVYRSCRPRNALSL